MNYRQFDLDLLNTVKKQLQVPVVSATINPYSILITNKGYTLKLGDREENHKVSLDDRSVKLLYLNVQGLIMVLNKNWKAPVKEKKVTRLKNKSFLQNFGRKQ